MTDALTHFPPTRTAALERMSAFVAHAGKTYASRRNYDIGARRHMPPHGGVSTLSPYLRTRLITETEVLEAVLGRFSLSSAEKFVQEVFWRTYWKGWLEMRPAVWDAYTRDLARDWDNVQTQGGLRRDWEAACLGQTGIDCFDHWAQELVQTGYLHNHARMWFASIWIFTLRLPWTLGADFFLRHLLDGDPASNTLSWRWVGGMQTQGKTYLARPDNIAKYTEGRFNPTGLAREAHPLPADPPVAALPLRDPMMVDPHKRTGFLLHGDDLSPGFALAACPAPVATIGLRAEQDISPLKTAPHIGAFYDAAFDDAAARFKDRFGPYSCTNSPIDVQNWAIEHKLEQIVTPYAPMGPVRAKLDAISAGLDIPLVAVRRPYDTAAWPHATHGFFRFKDKIPKLVSQIKGLQAVG